MFAFHVVTAWHKKDQTMIYLYLIINIPLLHLRVTQSPLQQQE